MAEAKIVNGVNVDDLEGAVNTLKLEENVGLAKFNFRVSNKWISGAHNRSTIGDFYGFGKENSRKAPFVLDSDEPPLLLGEDKGPDPVELVLNGLATCLTTTLVYHGSARGIEIEELETRVEGDLDLRGFLGASEGVRPGFQRIRVTFRVKTRNNSADRLKELAKFSPALDMLSHGLPISIELETA